MTRSFQLAQALGAYIDALGDANILARPDGAMRLDRTTPIAYATDDSRLAQPGTLFTCKGATFKREYLLSAIDAGAVVYVSETDYAVSIPCILVTNIRRALAVLADTAYGHPSGRIDICALTGTKGKTTTAYYLKSILDAEAARTASHPAALITGVEVDDGVEHMPSQLTTPESFELERHIAHAVSAGASHVVMEASSQALKYDRTACMDFAVGAFTNFGEDHISPIEHPTLEDYFQSKLKIFSQSACAVVNADMDCAPQVLEAACICPRVLTYSSLDASADIYASDIVHVDQGIRLHVRTPQCATNITIPTPARFNVENALAAIACAVALGAHQESIVGGLAEARVPGRMEVYPSRTGDIIGVVDYAHNGMSLEALLTSLRESYPTRELAVVFGATGGKGLDRRTDMGRAAGKLADRIIITEDDPGPEAVEDICRTIAEHIEAQGNHNWKIVTDRPQAIRTAALETTRPCVLVVTGKGHERAMKRANGSEPYEGDGPLLIQTLAQRDEA